MPTGRVTIKDIKLARRIRRAREKIGLTQDKLAQKAHISTTHLALFETGKRRISLKTLQKVASALGKKVRDLIPF